MSLLSDMCDCCCSSAVLASPVELDEALPAAPRMKRFSFCMSWESDRPGIDMALGGFVRISPGAGLYEDGEQAMGQLVKRVADDLWLVDLGEGADCACRVHAHHMHRILVDLDNTALHDRYMDFAFG